MTNEADMNRLVICNKNTRGKHVISFRILKEDLKILVKDIVQLLELTKKIFDKKIKDFKYD